MKKESEVDLTKIQLLVLDVDGVLTNGTIEIHSDGSESKSFSLYDEHGIRMLRRAGLKVAFLSGRQSKPTKCHAEQLEVDFVFEGCYYKLPVLEKLVEQLGLSADNVAYIGDDLLDLPPVKYAGFGVAVANSADELKQAADYVTEKGGGSGAVRETIEYILKSTGQWQQLMERYT